MEGDCIVVMALVNQSSLLLLSHQRERNTATTSLSNKVDEKWSTLKRDGYSANLKSTNLKSTHVLLVEDEGSSVLASTSGMVPGMTTRRHMSRITP